MLAYHAKNFVPKLLIGAPKIKILGEILKTGVDIIGFVKSTNLSKPLQTGMCQV